MSHDSQTSIDEVIAELFQQEWYRQEELCTQLGIGPDVLAVCLRWEIIQPSHRNQEGEDLFSTVALDRLCRGLRLHRDLGINWAGVTITLDLLDRISELERTLRDTHENEWTD
ncbi:MAG: chaperone modulator CbpM [Nitrospirales bacterium]